MAAVNDIVRYAGDTYPNKTIIKIGGVPIDLDGWDVEVRYKDNGVIKVVDCVLADKKHGKVLIYPHSRGENDAKLTENTAANQCWTSEAEYKFSLIRRKMYGTYEEVMTHNVGVIKILERI